MIISHKHKFVFVHNPKAAGSAIRMALEHLHDDEMKFWHQGFVPELDRVVDLAHLTFKELLAIRPQCQNYLVFGVVRDPYERFVSGLQEHMRQHSVSINKIDDWIHRCMDETNFRYNWKYVHLCPQHYFFDGAKYPTIMTHSVVGWRWEQFRRDMALTMAMDIRELPTTRVRPDSGKLSVSDLSKYAIGAIEYFYQYDFRAFGYNVTHGDSISKYLDHHERVNGIHSPYLSPPMLEHMTEGEQKAYTQKHGEPT